MRVFSSPDTDLKANTLFTGRSYCSLADQIVGDFQRTSAAVGIVLLASAGLKRVTSIAKASSGAIARELTGLNLKDFGATAEAFVASLNSLPHWAPSTPRGPLANTLLARATGAPKTDCIGSTR